MKRFLLLGFSVLTVASASAQLPQIRITGVFPPGAQQGTSLDVTITAGSDLDEASELIFNHPGIKAVPRKDGNGNPIANQFTVTVDSSVEAGLYDVRLRGLFGISNPRIFRVDLLPELQETEPNNTNDQAQSIDVNTIVNARSNGGADVDVFRIAAKAGQTIVIRSEAAVLDSLMQPVLELFDSSGRRVTHARRQKHQDAAIVFTSDVDQSILLKVHDTVYAGSNDYGYRLSIDTRPLVDFVSPAILQAGVDSTVTLFGRHLPGGQPSEFTIDNVPVFTTQASINLPAPEGRAVGTDSSAASIDSAIFSGIEGNLLPFALSSTASNSVAETEADSPQTVAVPAAVSGRFAAELDEDSFRFEAKKGEQWQIEVLAHRLGSTADPLLIVEQITTAEDGTETAKRLAREDQSKQNPGGGNLPSLTSDPSFLLTAPADGIYQLRLRDRFGASRGSASLSYTVTIDKPTADFRAVVFDSLPSPDGKAPASTGAISIRKGGTYEVPVYAYRSGGHNSDISLTVEGLPEGVTCADSVIRTGKVSTLLVFSAADGIPETVAPIRIVATSVAGEQTLQHSARVATLVHDGANGLPRTGRVTGSLLLSVMKDEEPFTIVPEIVSVDVHQDQQLLIPVQLTRRTGFVEKVDLAFSGQPGNVDIPKVAIEKEQTDTVARFYFKENAAAGPATLLLYATAQVPYRRNPWQVDRAKAKVDEATKRLETSNKALTDAKTAADESAKKLTDLAADLKTYNEQLHAEQALQVKAQADLKTALATRTEASKQLLALMEQLNAAAANTKPENENLDAAIKAVQDASNAVTEAAKPIQKLTEQLQQLNAQVAEKQKVVAEKNKQIEQAQAAMKTQQAAVEKAMAEVAAAEQSLKAGEAEKAAADAAVKKAEEAAKPQNKNVRSIAVPVQITVHPAAGKITAAVPNGGAIKKGTTAEVKVTVARKNNFASPVKVSLVLPPGSNQVTSNTVDLAADQTETTLTLSAAADAAAADIAHAVIRATGEFNGRAASFDAPIALKVTE